MKSCQSCGRYFHPHPRVGEHQQCCGRAECRKKYEKKYRKTWKEENPDYFKGRYPKIKEWLDKNPGYLKTRRKKQRDIQNLVEPASPVMTLTIVVPAKVFEGDIQNSIRLVRQCSCGMWLPG